jgi:hypothetical protein
MKTSQLLRLLLLFIAVISLTVTGCKKDNPSDPSTDTSSMQQLSKDETNFENATDEAMNDAELILSGSGEKSTDMWPCNANLDSTNIINDTIYMYVTFNGTNCAETRFRTGRMIIMKKVGENWLQPGAKVFVKYINLHITKIASGKSITFNGRKKYVNVSGGWIGMVGNGLDALVHRVSGNIEATFDDNSTRTWNIARQRVFTGTLGNLVMTTSGFGSAGEYSNLVIWGTNRNGEDFFSTISQPIVHRQQCDWDPCSGVRVTDIPGNNKSLTVTFGFDDNNQPVTGEDCPTRYRVDWVKGNNSGTLFLPLP